MNKENILLFAIGGLIILSLIGALVFVQKHEEKIPSGLQIADTSPTPVTQKSEEKFAEVPMVSDKHERSTDPVAHYTYDVHYPVIALAQHPDLAKETNTVISAFVHDVINDFKESAADMYSGTMDNEVESDFAMTYNPLLLSPTMISIRFDYSEYIAGAAHPNTQTRILNYDIEKHLLLTTSDLFASSDNALPFLSRYTRDALKKTMTDVSKDAFGKQVLPGTEPTHDNFEEVAITREGLLVIFNPYQVAPYARGTIAVPVPLDDLTDVLDARTLKAIGLASTNIVEATPENTPLSTPTKMEY